MRVGRAIGRMPGVDAWPARFGASDCGCPGHLLRLPGPPDQIELVKAALRVGLNLGSVLAV